MAQKSSLHAVINEKAASKTKLAKFVYYFGEGKPTERKDEAPARWQRCEPGRDDTARSAGPAVVSRFQPKSALILRA